MFKDNIFNIIPILQIFIARMSEASNPVPSLAPYESKISAEIYHSIATSYTDQNLVISPFCWRPLWPFYTWAQTEPRPRSCRSCCG